ncbi:MULTISPECIES: DUF4145 domain-containing protein [Vibrio]|uniref:DUF4145 domain-containing protein n=1 Tax=Vibrio casei TaxID=673372 RepID=A0A368LKW8_9VIBR|nr:MULTISPECIES: DUF4145 domain-containing protein [Vibrio]RCS72153.1 DUF4145 domain-containing protein [Vibrio casei]HBV76542.1 DUF4145 domain-containing protein [Vibrio sp.]
MSDIEKVVSHTRRLERLLREQYHATGQGLLELTESCASRLPHDVVQKIHYISSIRQQLLDDDDYQLKDKEAFIQLCIECEKELTPRSGKFIWGVAIFLVILMTIGALLFYTIHWDVVMKYL